MTASKKLRIVGIIMVTISVGGLSCLAYVNGYTLAAFSIPMLVVGLTLRVLTSPEVLAAKAEEGARVIAAFPPPPAQHSWDSPAADCGYRHLKPGDSPVCTCQPRS